MRVEKVTNIIVFGSGAIFFTAVLGSLICVLLKVGSDALRITLFMVAVLSAGVGGIGGAKLSAYERHIRKTKASTHK